MIITPRLKTLLVETAELSDCRRLKVAGALLDKAGHVHFLAHNFGDGKCNGVKGQCGCTHAEERLLKQALVKKTSETRYIMVLTHNPCMNCAIKIVNSGIVDEVYFLNPYRDIGGILYLERCNITCRRINL